MTFILNLVDNLLYNETCIETGMQCAAHVGHVFGY